MSVYPAKFTGVIRRLAAYILILVVVFSQSSESSQISRRRMSNDVSPIPETSLGQNCSWNSDCTHIRFAHCHDGICSCYPYHIRHNATLCLPASLLGFGCLVNDQCAMKVPNSRCAKGVCRCAEGFTQLRLDRCLAGARVNQFCASDEQCQLSSPRSFCRFIIPRVYGRCMCASGLTTDQDKRCVPLARAEVAVSLGHYCDTSDQCKARDPASHCVNHTCDCVIPNQRCNAKISGCHKDTFQCRDGRCISWYYVCNGQYDCDDGSDEETCIQGNCPKEAFQCNNGNCVSRAKLCNGKMDCIDGSDEINCYNNCNTSRTLRCGDGPCLPQYMFCNAVVSCKDGSDEDPNACELGKYCPEEHFRCNNGRCRSTAILCSGKDGCGDNSDEEQCRVCRCPKIY